MKKGEKLGRGIVKIRKWVRAKGLKVKFESGAFFTAIFFRGKAYVDAVMNEGLNGGLKTLLFAINNNPGVQVKNLSKLLDSRPVKTLERQIASLVKKKLIERRGSKKTGGYFSR